AQPTQTAVCRVPGWHTSRFLTDTAYPEASSLSRRDSDSASTQKAFEADLLLVHTSPVRGATGGLVRRNHGDGSRSFTGIIGPPESSLGAFLVHGILREYIPACCPVKPVAPDHIRRGRNSDRPARAGSSRSGSSY